VPALPTDTGPFESVLILSLPSMATSDVARLRALIDAATAADGVAPVSEHTLLRAVAAGDDEGGGSGHDGAGDPSGIGGAVRATGDELFLLASVGGQDERDDVLAGFGYLSLASARTGRGASAELVVHPEARRRGIGGMLLAELTERTKERSHTTLLRVWAHGDLPAAAALAARAGFTIVRTLWLFSRPLSGPGDEPPEVALPDGVTVRTFRPGQDEAAWLTVNARAFASHAEQGGLTMADLRLRERQPWFDPKGFFVAERDGRMVGFHWTKVHPPRPGRARGVGEVYVLGVDPDEQGSGLGRALAVAGLRHLRDGGLDEVILYVDGENTGARRLYQRLGFAERGVDVMYQSD
jgi:mycothiol synthase